MTQTCMTLRALLACSSVAFAVQACGTKDSDPQDQQSGVMAGAVAPTPPATTPPVTTPPVTTPPVTTPPVATPPVTTPPVTTPPVTTPPVTTPPVTMPMAGAAGMAMGNAGAAGGAGNGNAGMAGMAGSAGSAGSSGSGGTGGSGTMIGNGGTVNATIVVRSGMTFDGGNKRYTAGAALGDGSQDEGQLPVFKLEDGAKITNVVLGSPAADGIHTYGDVTLQNIVWEDIGEDALTIKESGTVVLDGGSATNGEDKVFQVNAASTFRISNFKASNAGKFMRQNGGTTFKIEVFIDKCDISNMDEAIVRVDEKATQSRVTMTNSRYSKIGGDSTSPAVLFKYFQPANVTMTGNTHY